MNKDAPPGCENAWLLQQVNQLVQKQKEMDIKKAGGVYLFQQYRPDPAARDDIFPDNLRSAS